MNFSGADRQALRLPMLVLAAALLAGAALVTYSYRVLAQEKRHHDYREGVVREARERMLRSGDEKERILRHRAAYAALQQDGFVGEERRINWVDALRIVSQNLQMSGVNYQIGAQQPYGAALDMDAGPYRVRQSLMRISLDLQHEEDLVRFVKALDEKHAGIFALRECSLQRQGDRAGRANLQAECNLAWLSLSETTEP